MRYLGIDYGTKRIGVALSDEEGTMAFPKEVVETNKNIVAQLHDMCQAEGVQQVIIGESKNLDGTPNPLMTKIEKFITEWEEQTKIPIVLEPEFFSSHQAQKIQGKNDMLDASAATIILQSFIDKKRNKTMSDIQEEKTTDKEEAVVEKEEQEDVKITYEDFRKVDMRIGTIKSVEKIEDTDKLLRLEVEFGEGEVRQIVSGIAEYYPDPQDLVGKQTPFVYNLEPRTIRGVESNGMILAVSGKVGFAALHPSKEVNPGSPLS